MPWSTIAASEVLEQISPQEATALQTIQGNSTTLAAVLSGVVNSARAYIRAGGNQMDAEGTIPDQFRQEVIDISLWRWLKSFPKLKQFQTDERKDAYTDALKTLKEVSRKDSGIRVELPAAATAEVNPAPVNSIRVVSKTRRQLRRRETGGL
jgi:hypothetical protein